MRRRRHQTHHKHSSTKGYRRLLDKVAAHEDVHRVATGRVKPRMGAGRPIAPISKVREIESGRQPAEAMELGDDRLIVAQRRRGRLRGLGRALRAPEREDRRGACRSGGSC